MRWASGPRRAILSEEKHARTTRPHQGGPISMTINIVATSVAKPPAKLIEAFKVAPTSIISDNLARLAGSVGLKPFHRAGRLVGAAVTIKTRPGDNPSIHRATEMLRPGDLTAV